MTTKSRQIVTAPAKGSLLHCSEGLSFWGGVDPSNGVIVDAHHPQLGESVAGRIVLMPTSRGSCSGSGVLLELAMNGHAPAALVFREEEQVLTLGALVATHLFDLPVSVVQLTAEDYEKLFLQQVAEISASRLVADGLDLALTAVDRSDLKLSSRDCDMLAGKHGEAAQLAMETLCTIASLEGAGELLDVSRAHIDACIYATPANLVFAERLAAFDAKVIVPTTMNAISVDRDNWRNQGVQPDFGDAAARTADAYVAMGAKPTFTCAPYQADDRPSPNEDIGWSESNAVIFANSVLGAHTPKHPDFLDLFIALTGRAPRSGVYLRENRRPEMAIDVAIPKGYDDAFWPLLGWLVGKSAPDCIPVIKGLEDTNPSEDDLRAMCAAFGTTSAAPMLHIAGVTPEGDLPVKAEASQVTITHSDFVEAWRTFNAGSTKIDLVSLGSPHFSLAEVSAFADLMEGRRCHLETSVMITLSRATKSEAEARGLVSRLEVAGVKLVCDVCWCSISEPLFPPKAKTLMTNSGKYAHYAPGLCGREVRFGNLADCAVAAELGYVSDHMPGWLT